MADTEALAARLLAHAELHEGLPDDEQAQWANDLRDAADLLAERDRLRAELERIARVANCESVDSWLALPDEHKRQWFALLVDESSRKAAAIREVDALRADVRELVECLTIIKQRTTHTSYRMGQDIHMTAEGMLAKHALQALADNAREMGLSYEGESDEHK